MTKYLIAVCIFIMMMIALTIYGCTIHKKQRSELLGLLSAYQLADSLNKVNYDKGTGPGWYSVNPWMKVKTKIK